VVLDLDPREPSRPWAAVYSTNTSNAERSPVYFGSPRPGECSKWIPVTASIRPSVMRRRARVASARSLCSSPNRLKQSGCDESRSLKILGWP
jgi:hypothetical protein